MTTKYRGLPLIQIFSVSVQLNELQSTPALSCTVDADGTIKPDVNTTSLVDQESWVKLYGTIEATMGPYVTHTLYTKDVESPEWIDLKHGTISLSGPSSSDKFSPIALGVNLQFHLRDALQNLEVSRGWFEFNSHQPDSYYDKRLSTTIEGNHGWATMHYTLFRRAIQALVTVKIILDGDTRSSPCAVFGSLYVRYGGHDYRYEYQKKYYRSVLFNKPPNDGVPLHENFMMLPLSASLLAVPMVTSLVIEGDLRVKRGETEIAVLNIIDVEFPQPHERGIANVKEVLGENAKIEVTVSWSLF